MAIETTHELGKLAEKMGLGAMGRGSGQGYLGGLNSALVIWVEL